MTIRRYRSPWSPADDRLLRDLAGDGYTVAEVAAELGRTRPAVAHRSKRVRPAVRFAWGPARDAGLRAWLLRLVGEGKRQTEIAAVMGRRLELINRWVGQLVADGLVGRAGRKRGTKLWLTRKWRSDTP